MSHSVRVEHDLLGDREVPADVYYGVHTARALENFPISGVPISRHSDLVVGLTSVKQAAAEADARAALARYQSTVLRAFTEVSDALADLGADDHTIANLTTAQRLAQASLNDYENGYRLGGVALLQVIDAQRVLNQVRRALVQAQSQRYSDLVRLYAATAATYRPDKVS